MNKQVILKKRPVGMPEADTWALENNPIPEVGEGQLLVKNHYTSLDPAMRGVMNVRNAVSRLLWWLAMVLCHADLLTDVSTRSMAGVVRSWQHVLGNIV